MIKAIETRYKGYRFRSRLEARWAVFFDALNISYQYEPQGYEINLSGDIVRYLPDFYLPEFGCHVEVKGGKCSKKDAEKMGWILDYNSPLPYMHNSDLDFSWDQKRQFLEDGIKNPCFGLILLGDVPYINHGIVYHPIITHREGLVRGFCEFMGLENSAGKINKVSGDCVRLMRRFSGDNGDFVSYMCGGESDVEFFDPKPMFAESKLANRTTCKAYQKARSARFEHGESP